MSKIQFTQAMVDAQNQRVRVGAVVAKVQNQQPQTAAQMRMPIVGHHKFTPNTQHQIPQQPKRKQKRAPSYNPKVVIAFFAEHGIPEPEFEYRFHPDRKWRFDLSWPKYDREIRDGNGAVVAIQTLNNAAGGLALEVQGGIFSRGRHTQGAALIKEWEKLNRAAELGWRVIYCQPTELCMDATAQMIKRCLKITA